MSKKQYIEDLERELAQAHCERDAYREELKADDQERYLQDQTRREAAVQEKIDGIKAGLIPVEQLRRAFDTLEIDAEGTAFVTYRFDKHADRVQKALSDALTAKTYREQILREFEGANLSGVPKFGDPIAFMYPPVKAA